MSRMQLTKTVIGYPSLIFRILKAQKPDLMNSTDIIGPPVIEMCINHKLYEGHHLWEEEKKIKRTTPIILLEFG